MIYIALILLMKMYGGGGRYSSKEWRKENIRNRALKG
jgi:hypothetical protein